MGRLISLIGERFSRLTVVRKSDQVHSSGALWECLCDCGAKVVANSLKLRSGHTKSCGCLRNETVANMNRTHGQSNKTLAYRSWKEMRQRCLNPNSDKWEWYGGRGITVCERWDSFEMFLNDMGERVKGTSIDRLDSDGNYEPSNCRWASAAEQATTNRGCHRKGVTPINKTPPEKLLAMREMRLSGMKIKDIAGHFGMHTSVVCTLIKHGARKK